MSLIWAGPHSCQSAGRAYWVPFGNSHFMYVHGSSASAFLYRTFTCQPLSINKAATNSGYGLVLGNVTLYWRTLVPTRWRRRRVTPDHAGPFQLYTVNNPLASGVCVCLIYPKHGCNFLCVVGWLCVKDEAHFISNVLSIETLYLYLCVSSNESCSHHSPIPTNMPA